MHAILSFQLLYESLAQKKKSPLKEQLSNFPLFYQIALMTHFEGKT